MAATNAWVGRAHGTPSLGIRRRAGSPPTSPAPRSFPFRVSSTGRSASGLGCSRPPLHPGERDYLPGPSGRIHPRRGAGLLLVERRAVRPLSPNGSVEPSFVRSPGRPRATGPVEPKRGSRTTLRPSCSPRQDGRARDLEARRVGRRADDPDLNAGSEGSRRYRSRDDGTLQPRYSVAVRTIGSNRRITGAER